MDNFYRRLVEIDLENNSAVERPIGGHLPNTFEAHEAMYDASNDRVLFIDNNIRGVVAIDALTGELVILSK